MLYLQEKPKKFRDMIQEYFYVSYGNYSGTTASMKEAKLMEKRFKSFERDDKIYGTCVLENAKSADNDSVNYL